MIPLYFYELQTIDSFDHYLCYYYFNSKVHIRSLSMNNSYPDKLKLLIKENNEEPTILKIMNPITYYYKKYIKPYNSFLFGYRVNWEKI